MFKGSCLCGDVRYEVRGELGDFGYCHCTSCRKASGSAFGANSPVDRERFTLLRGEASLRELESSPGKLRVFCSRCGSPLYAYLRSTPDILRLRLGSLDTPFDKRVKAHTFVSDKASWENVPDDAPHFAKWADPAVLRQLGSKQGEPEE